MSHESIENNESNSQPIPIHEHLPFLKHHDYKNLAFANLDLRFIDSEQSASNHASDEQLYSEMAARFREGDLRAMGLSFDNPEVTFGSRTRAEAFIHVVSESKETVNISEKIAASTQSDKTETYLKYLSWCIPKDIRANAIGDVLEECEMLRADDCSQWQILYHVLSEVTTTAISAIIGSFVNMCADKFRAIQGCFNKQG